MRIKGLQFGCLCSGEKLSLAITPEKWKERNERKRTVGPSHRRLTEKMLHFGPEMARQTSLCVFIYKSAMIKNCFRVSWSRFFASLLSDLLLLKVVPDMEEGGHWECEMKIRSCSFLRLAQNATKKWGKCARRICWCFAKCKKRDSSIYGTYFLATKQTRLSLASLSHLKRPGSRLTVEKCKPEWGR